MRASSLHEGSCVNVIVERTFLTLAHPNPDQVARHIVTRCQTMQRLASDKLLRDLPFEFHTVNAMFCHGLHFRKPGKPGQFIKPICPPSGAHSKLRHTVRNHEIVTWRQLSLHLKPVVFVGGKDFWAVMEETSDRMFDAGFLLRE